MRTLKSKRDIKTIMIVSIIMLVILGINGWKNMFFLNKNPLKAKAVITKIYTVRYSDYYKYTFKIKNKIYLGNGRYNNALSVGDTIIIIYEKTNPKNNKPLLKAE